MKVDRDLECRAVMTQTPRGQTAHVEVEPDHITDLVDEQRVAAQLPQVLSMRL